MKWGSSRRRAAPLGFRSSAEAGGWVGVWSRASLWLAVLLFGGHAGASLYEMLVVMPLWTAESAEALRQWSATTQDAIRLMAYKEPAALALGMVSIVLLWLSMWRPAAFGWMLVSSLLGIVLVAATVLFAFPFLERSMQDVRNGTDGEILRDMQAWQLWCMARLALLMAAWAASLFGLLRASSRSSGQWHAATFRL
jgi:hypothetical protein